MFERIIALLHCPKIETWHGIKRATSTTLFTQHKTPTNTLNDESELNHTVLFYIQSVESPEPKL